jgi:3-oxoadipate enol-lactonase
MSDLLLVNSLGTTKAVWDLQMPALSERFRVHRYDMRGHGDAPAPPGPYSMADLGTDLLDLLDQLELERVSLCGLSIGGMVAMWVASEAPERIDRLALCCTSAKLGTPESWDERIAEVRAGGTAAVAVGAIERWFTPGVRPGVIAPVREMLLATSPEGYAGCCAAIRDMDLRDRLASITAPTLVMAASDDPSTPPEHGEAIAAAIDGARFHVIPRARHLANVERPDEFTAAIMEHLR